MNDTLAGRVPAVNPQRRLSGADRALMLAIAERERAQGKIGIEEYQYIQDQCQVHMGAALVQRVLRLVGRGGVARFPVGQPGDPVLQVLPPRVEAIPVSSIVGSVDRAEHLDRRFRPLHGGRARLEQIRKAMEDGVPFLPIDVYRLDGAYYVIDGHHRVAAALQLGQLYLDAVVSECWAQRDELAYPLAAARREFCERTGLQALSFSTPDRYGQALHQVHEHCWYLGERGRVLSLPEAAQDWYQVTYLPALQHMIVEGLAPLRTPGEAGDRYLDLCDLRERLSRERGREIGFAEALRVGEGQSLRRAHAAPRRMRQAHQG